MSYAWGNRLRLWFLGYNYKDVKEKLFQANSIKKSKPFVKDCLKEFYSVLKWSEAAVLVPGTGKLNGRIMDMAEEVRPIAEEIGFNVQALVSDGISKSNKYPWRLDGWEGVDREAIPVLTEKEFTLSSIQVDWSSAKPTSMVKECIEVAAI